MSKEVRQLIRQMSRGNPLWGAPRIHGELLKLGIDIGETSVAKYIVRRRKPPSQNYRTFLENHIKAMVSIRLLHSANDPFSGPVTCSWFCLTIGGGSCKESGPELEVTRCYIPLETGN
jgi:hypothetical protein